MTILENGKNEPYFEIVIFVPHTPNSELEKNLTEMENILGFMGKARYIETMVQTVEDILVKKDPWSLHCKRDKCFLCK